MIPAIWNDNTAVWYGIFLGESLALWTIHVLVARISFALFYLIALREMNSYSFLNCIKRCAQRKKPRVYRSEIATDKKQPKDNHDYYSTSEDDEIYDDSYFLPIARQVVSIRGGQRMSIRYD